MQNSGASMEFSILNYVYETMNHCGFLRTISSMLVAIKTGII